MNDYPEKAKKVLVEFQKKISRYENAEMILLADKWGEISLSLSELIKKLSEKEFKTPDQLYRLELYRELIKKSNHQITIFNKFAVETIKKGQAVFGEYGLKMAQKSISLITMDFNRLNTKAINNFIGLTSKGSPLYDLFKTSYGDNVSKLTNTLLTSNALGYNPQKTAKLLVENMNGNFMSRALTIARTEQLNILRQTSIEQMKNSGVCRGWIRIEQPDACDECLSENGKRYNFDESFDSHPNCRGAAIPDI